MENASRVRTLINSPAVLHNTAASIVATTAFCEIDHVFIRWQTIKKPKIFHFGFSDLCTAVLFYLLAFSVTVADFSLPSLRYFILTLSPGLYGCNDSSRPLEEKM